ncbi:Putative ribonuclease H protein At1g65750 [Linum perenne]
MTLDASCDRCHHPEESVLHVLRDCQFVADVWTAIGGFIEVHNFWSLSDYNWFCHFLNSEQALTFGVVCWLLWKERNARLFANSVTPTTKVAFSAKGWVNSIFSALDQDNKLLGGGIGRQRCDVSWDPEPEGWVTLNSDGSVRFDSKKATAGGLLRNMKGRLLFAFTMNLGCCSITRAELRGAIEGLTRTWEAGFRKVVLQLDSKTAIALMTSGKDTTHQHGLESLKLQDLLNRDWTVKVQHTYREGNHAADFFASIGYDYPLGSHTIYEADC